MHWDVLVAVQDWDSLRCFSQNLVGSGDPNQAKNPISHWGVLAAVRRLPDMNLTSCTVTTS